MHRGKVRLAPCRLCGASESRCRAAWRGVAGLLSRYARYFYYTGRIKAIRLEYTEAHNYLLDAIRKAPQTGAVGFRLEVRRPAPPR